MGEPVSLINYYSGYLLLFSTVMMMLMMRVQHARVVKTGWSVWDLVKRWRSVKKYRWTFLTLSREHRCVVASRVRSVSQIRWKTHARAPSLLYSFLISYKFIWIFSCIILRFFSNFPSLIPRHTRSSELSLSEWNIDRRHECTCGWTRHGRFIIGANSQGERWIEKVYFFRDCINLPWMQDENKFFRRAQNS